MTFTACDPARVGVAITSLPCASPMASEQLSLYTGLWLCVEKSALSYGLSNNLANWRGKSYSIGNAGIRENIPQSGEDSMRALLAATALSTTIAIASPVLAQDAAQDSAQDASNGAGIGEIVVTAQKRSENIQNVPIAISAVSSQFLETRGITSIDSLGSIAPNVKFERAPSNKTISQIAIRGSVTINPAVTFGAGSNRSSGTNY
ncbi:MAG: hypothetical protein NTX28_02665 [Novosphingobium sp.]|nr:hypothetical protein [Novosphingobium sp.]